MDIAWTVVGHHPQKGVLTHHLRERSFPHAYLFNGPAGIGKMRLAVDFAARILDVKQAHFSPDFSFYNACDLNAESIRDVLAALGAKPLGGLYKVVIFDNIQAASTQSANALLKTLEEPSNSTIIILIAGGGPLLPTVVSRCVILNFARLNDEDMRLATASFDTIDPMLIAVSGGRPGKLQQLLNDEPLKGTVTVMTKKLLESIGRAPHEKLTLLEELADYEPEVLVIILEAWLRLLMQRLSLEPGLYTRVKSITEAITDLAMPLNKKLILQHLLLVP